MRYTTRSRHVDWEDDPAPRKAVEYLERLLGIDSPFTFRAKLQPGMGLISNNVPLDRDGLGGACGRLMQRLRHGGPVSDTD